jgi:nitrite reductase/ring-hydroxylating ferredoxin subunit
LDRKDAVTSPPQTRRDFCVHACRAVSLITVGAALQNCGSPTGPSDASAPKLPTINGSVAAGTVTVTVDAASPLAPTGSAALVQSSAGNFLVSRAAQDAFTALTAICTHEGCVVDQFASPVFVCPCHGSRYNTGGDVVNGPATRPLRQFTTRFAASVLTITL